MARSGSVTRHVETFGIREAGEVLLATAGALNNVAAGAPLVYRILNDEYRQKFRNWEGRGRDGKDYMVQTGKTRQAWTSSQTESGNGAIRRAHGATVEYGSSIFYNKFHWRALTAHSSHLDDLLAETMADYFVPDTARFTRGYYQTRGGRRVFVRPYLSRGRMAEPQDS
jgi:hypothetical protein